MNRGWRVAYLYGLIASAAPGEVAILFAGAAVICAVWGEWQHAEAGGPER